MKTSIVIIFIFLALSIPKYCAATQSHILNEHNFLLWDHKINNIAAGYLNHSIYVAPIFRGIYIIGSYKYYHGNIR